jgi:hypothetical protein
VEVAEKLVVPMRPAKGGGGQGPQFLGVIDEGEMMED